MAETLRDSLPRPVLHARNVRRNFGDKKVLAGISLDVAANEILVMLGPSGCGKTTLLNILAGFDMGGEHDELLLMGRPISEPSTEIGIVFQDDNLFPWFTLRENILFGSEISSLPRVEREQKLQKHVMEFALEDCQSQYPDQLSGGQRQRGAVARALINEPRILLADEPFRALDSRTRLQSQSFLRHEIKSVRCSACLVTHDIDEALLLGDRIVILTNRPARIVEEAFHVILGAERPTSTVLSERFLAEKMRLVEFCDQHGMPLFPKRTTFDEES